MISVGPTLLDVHTPNETCKIEDVKITTELLIEILERIAKIKRLHLYFQFMLLSTIVSLQVRSRTAAYHAVRLLAIYVCQSMLYMITCRFHGFCIAANESMSEWKPSSPSMAAAANGCHSWNAAGHILAHCGRALAQKRLVVG